MASLRPRGLSATPWPTARVRRASLPACRAATQVVLEGYQKPELTVDWGGDDIMAYPVTALDEGLSAFFKDQ